MSEHQARVSVVIPALNEADYLPALLTSLEAQTLPVHEIVLADAGSTDATVEIAEAGGARIVPGGLPAVGRNNGAEVATGDWLLFLDADLVLQPTDVATALEEATRRGLDGASCAFVPDSRSLFLRFNHWLSSHYFRISTAVRWPHSIGGFLLVRTATHHALNGFDTTITVAEDQDYVLRMARSARYGFLMQPVVEVAARRFEKTGSLRMSLRWIVIELHRLLLGEIRGNYIPYFDKPSEEPASAT